MADATEPASEMTADLETMVSLAKRRGFVFQSAEIYGGFSAAYDYGPLGVEMRRNIRELWWRNIVQERDDVVGVEAAIITNPEVWRASGHLDTFTDPLVECLECHTRHRADHIENNTCPDCGTVGRFTEELFMLQRAIRMGDGDYLHDYFTHTRAIRRGIIEAGQETADPDFGRKHGSPKETSKKSA